MKLYKPLHHIPITGRGYEGAEPWTFTPSNAPYEQSYITLEDFPGKRFWTWGIFATLERVSDEILAELRDDGWEPWDDSNRTAFFLLENQFAQTLIVSEQNGHVRNWAQTEAIQHAQTYPVFLSYQTQEEEEYPNFLPPDMLIGTCALIHENDAWHLYTIDQLDETSQSLSQTIREGMMLFPPDADPSAQETRLRNQQRVERWEATHVAAQQLATLYWKLHQEHRATKIKIKGLPTLTSAHRTRIPALASFQSLTQSFGPAIQPSTWKQQQADTLELVTPNGSLLRVVGTNTGETTALRHYVTSILDPEGLKHLLILLDAYYFQTNGEDRKADARVSLRQLLLRLGKGSKADEQAEQHKLMHTILYLARTYIRTQPDLQQTGTTKKPKPLPLARQRKSRTSEKAYSPLLVIEGLKPGFDGTITIPEEIEYHLGYEFFEALFGTQQQFFTVPTAQLLHYHAVRQQQELLLAFYLSNALTASAEPFSVPFPTLLLQSALQTQEELNKGHDRLRDVSRVLLAIEQLEQDELIVRASHETIDTALAAELALTEKKRTRKQTQKEQQDFARVQDSQGMTRDTLAQATYARISPNATYLQQLSETEIKQTRRVALQHLLDKRFNTHVDFTPGRLLQEQLRQHITRQQAAQESREQTQKKHSPSKKKQTAIIDAKKHTEESEETNGNHQPTEQKKTGESK